MKPNSSVVLFIALVTKKLGREEINTGDQSRDNPNNSIDHGIQRFINYSLQLSPSLLRQGCVILHDLFNLYNNEIVTRYSWNNNWCT